MFRVWCEGLGLRVWDLGHLGRHEKLPHVKVHGFRQLLGGDSVSEAQGLSEINANPRTTTSQTCAVVPRRARILGSETWGERGGRERGGVKDRVCEGDEVVVDAVGIEFLGYLRGGSLRLGVWGLGSGVIVPK